VKKPDLKIVSPVTGKAKATDEMRRRRISSCQRILLNAALAYITDGTDGTRNDRLRTASNLSGIPLTLIDAALKS
jgi:hypothetical protein